MTYMESLKFHFPVKRMDLNAWIIFSFKANENYGMIKRIYHPLEKAVFFDRQSLFWSHVQIIYMYKSKIQSRIKLVFSNLPQYTGF